MKKILPFLIVLATAGTSCHKFLKESSQSEFTPQTTEDYSELLFGTGYPRSILPLQQQVFFMDDDIQNYCGTMTTLSTNAKPLPAYSWQPDYYQQLESSAFTSGNGINSYLQYYKLISGANIAIQYADGSIGNQADKNFLKGQAYALRAYDYFMLVNLYGRPYNDSTTTPDKSPGVPLLLAANLSQEMPVRNSVAEVYTRIQKDLDSAIYLLDIERRNSDPYRVNYLAAHLLASRVNLYLGQWDSVISNASAVLQNFNTLADLNTWSGTPNYNVGVKSVENIWTFGTLLEYANGYNGNCYDVSTNLASTFQSGDLRTGAYYLPVPFIIQLLFVPTAYQDGKRDYSNSSAATTANSFRTSEAYLNRAEAYAEKYLLTGDNTAMTAALQDLNTLRQNRFSYSSYQALTAMSASDLLQFCRDERRRELFHEECHRWFDLRRYGMPSISHVYHPTPATSATYTLQSHDLLYTLPLPTEALQLNSNLIQNPLPSAERQSN